jgi:hypothetical protein
MLLEFGPAVSKPYLRLSAGGDGLTHWAPQIYPEGTDTVTSTQTTRN